MPRRIALHQLDDGGATDGQALTWDATSEEWVPSTPGGSLSLDDLTDVDTTGVATGDALVFDGSDWVPAAVAIPPGGTDGQVLTKQSGTDYDADWETPSGGSSWTSVVDDPLSSTTNLKTALSGTWAINAGVLRQSLAVNATAYRISHVTTFESMAKMAAEVEVAYVSGTGTRRIGMLFRSNNQTQYNQLFYLESTNGTTWDIRIEADAAALMWNGPTVSYAGSGYVKIRVVASGQGFDIWLDSAYIGYMSWGANTYNNENSLKFIGLYTYGASADFRNLKAWTQPDVPW